MAEKLTRKGVVLAKVEDSYGVDIVPAAVDLVLCGIPQHAVTGNKRERNYMRDSLSNAGFVVGAKKQTIEIICELKGPGNVVAPKTPTYLEPLLQACGLVAADGTIDVDDCRVYTPTSNSALMKSATIYYYLDGILHAIVGCRGTATMEFPADGSAQITFNMTGFYVAPSDAAANVAGAPDLKYEPPPVLSAGLKIGAYTPTGIEKITLDLGNTIAEKKDINSETGLSSILITGRQPKLTLDIDMDTLAAFNPYDRWEKGTIEAISWMIGAKGNRVSIACANPRMDEPQKADKDGRAIWNLTYLLTGSDDDYIIKTG